MRGAGIGEDMLVGAGLAYRSQADRLIDSFRARLLFPIFDVAGRPVGLGGRVLPGASGPKYKNTQSTPLYDKSRVLYGLNWAKGAIVERSQVVVCEGYTDVIGLHRAGVTEAVATCGTALAEGHVRLLTGFSRRIVLAYDADAAGRGAAERFYEWERRFEADISVVALPAGTDPADLAQTDPERLRQAVVDARPYLGFRLDRLFVQADLRNPEGRARAAETALGLISEHPDALGQGPIPDAGGGPLPAQPGAVARFASLPAARAEGAKNAASLASQGEAPSGAASRSWRRCGWSSTAQRKWRDGSTLRSLAPTWLAKRSKTWPRP